jgi:transcriptional regulator with XRE-family HTH domain
MKLADWRRGQEMTQQQLADELGCILTTVARYETGLRKPDDPTMIAIYRLTGGQVQPNDFYELPSLAEAQLDPAA